MEGAIGALRERYSEPQVALIVNELTDESRAALVDGYAIMAIATPLTELCRDLVDMMIVAAGQSDDGVSGQYFLEPRLHLPEII